MITTMTQDRLRRPRKKKHDLKNDGDFINRAKRNSYLVESFALNSKGRVVSRRRKGKKTDDSIREPRLTESFELLQIRGGTGRKIQDVDLKILTSHFENYTKVVNLILSRIYKKRSRIQLLGKKLSQYRGRAYALLRRERDLCYQRNQEYRNLVYERLHRNALEHAGRTLLADWTRRQLLNSAVDILDSSLDNVVRLLEPRRVPARLVRIVRDSCDAVRNNGAGFHYALGVLKQLRLALDRHILDILSVKTSWRGSQRNRVTSLLRENSSDRDRILSLVAIELKRWVNEGYPFTTPQLKRYSLDFSVSTENNIGQGYWFTVDSERENEVLLHLKLPPGIDGRHDEESPYRGKTLTFKFLDWLPRASERDRVRAERAEELGNYARGKRLRFRASVFIDMHTQLLNTIELQHLTRKLRLMRKRKNSGPRRTLKLEKRIGELKSSRRSAPPRLLLRSSRTTLQIPFLAPDSGLLEAALGEREYHSKAGVDRGIRVPVVLSVMKEKQYRDLLLSVEHLIGKRKRLRKLAYRLQSGVDKNRNNWGRKREGVSCPGHILKKEKHIEALWRKFGRLDREIARLVASRAVWFCEKHGVKTMFFEDLRSFQAKGGSKDFSWHLTTNLWGKIIDTVRYMRMALGHSRYSVWTVNPRYTSQTCHVCGESGVRVKDEVSTKEVRGGRYFYCIECKLHIHADVNAARNIIHVHPGPSAVPGRAA